MIFKTHEPGRKPQTYEGFRMLSHDKAKAAEVIAVVFMEGEVETWQLDAANVDLAVRELGRYYRSEFRGLNADVVVYRNPMLCLSDTAD